MDIKGELGGTCNRSACETKLKAFYYNHSTQKHYCHVCAEMINKMNPESLDIYGHPLCTLDEKKAIQALSNDIPYKKEGQQNKKIYITSAMEAQLIASGLIEKLVDVEVRENPLFPEYEKEMKVVLTNPYEHLKFADGIGANVPQYIRKDPKINNNDRCPCGSGKKYKKCCKI